jgi:hypothetical protein
MSYDDEHPGDQHPGQEAANEPAPTQPSNLPQLGVPSLGVPSLGTPQPSTYTDPDPNDPRNYPGALPAHLNRPPVKKRRRVGVGRALLLIFLLLAGLGWLARTIRQASATPADKTACSATLSAFTTPATGMPLMLHDLEFANDKTLLGARGDMTTHIAQRNVAALGNDLNRVIKRCNDLSSQFRSGFKSFCDTHAGMCKETFHVGPF